jgi:putative toxin-antitoxin system antitoxin component (TIGR02293 family)
VLTRYVDPGFYAVGRESTWIGEVAASDPAVRMDLVRHGVPAQAVAALADALAMSRDELTRELALPRATVERKLRDGGHLGQAESERVLGVVHLIAQVRRIVEESGDPTGFDAALWTADWLRTPAPALGGRLPVEYMDTAEGRAIVSRLVAQMQSGAYA